jgi:hypothetical protein
MAKRGKVRRTLLSTITRTARTASSYRLAGLIPRALATEARVDKLVRRAEVAGWGMGAGSAEMRGQEGARPYKPRPRKPRKPR